MKLKKLTGIIVAAVMISGCGGGTGMNQDRITEQMMRDFQTSMEQDMEGDGKTVVWTGTDTGTEEDGQDHAGVLDGRKGTYGMEAVTTDGFGFSIRLNGKYEMQEAGAECLVYRGEDWLLEVRKISYEEEADRLEKDPNYYEISDRITAGIRKRYAGVRRFTGLKETSGRIYAGYAQIIEDPFGNAYRLEYSGIGSMNAIAAQASCLFSSFYPIFDPNQQ